MNGEPQSPAPDSGTPEGARLDPFGWWEYDLRNGRVEWDPRARRILGIPGSGVLTLDRARSVIHPDDLALADAVLAEALKPGGSGHYSVQKRINRADGDRWVRTIGHIQHDEDGEPVRLIGIVEDITYAVDADRPFESAITGSDIILAHYDTDLRYTWVYNADPHFEAHAAVGHRDDELAPPESVAELTALKRETIDQDRELSRVVEVIVAGEPRYYTVHARPLHGPSGAVVGAVTAAAEVTEPVLSERAAREASEAKSRLMSLVSHELRTPLAGILGHADLLEQGVPVEIPEEALEHVRRIQTGVTHMHALIDELLTFARLEAGRERPEVNTVAPADVAREAISLVDGAAREEGLDLRLETVDGLPDLRTDGRRVVQLLVNLLGNAIKYTEDGAVTLRVERTGEHCLFHVIDTGIGIAEDHLDKIFEPFWRAPRSDGSGRRGNGLGLPVALQTARLLNGDIEVSSRVGEGSRLTLHLPLTD